MALAVLAFPLSPQYYLVLGRLHHPNIDIHKGIHARQ